MDLKTIFQQKIILVTLILLTHKGMAQMATNIEEDFDFLTAEWLDVSGELKTYGGLERFCTSADFREKSIDILSLLHQYDSLVLEILLDPSYDLEISHREYKHTIKDIQKFEEEFSIQDFIAFLKKNCRTWKDLERNREDLMKASGAYSYDGQRLVLETQLRKFLKHIDKKIIAIDDHVHLIHIDQVRPFGSLSENQ